MLKKNHLIRFVFAIGVCSAITSHATPLGAPLSELQGKELSLGVFYDQSGQNLFKSQNLSSLNTMGVALEYGLVNYVEVGAFAGAANFKVGKLPGQENNSNLRIFDPGLTPYGGGSTKLSTPRFIAGTTRFVASGLAGYFQAKDDNGNKKQAAIYNAGLTVQSEVIPRSHLILGAEFYALDGSQRSVGDVTTQPLGISIPDGEVNYLRGVVGFEYFFKGPNRSFISILFRPTSGLSYDDNFGLQGGSIAITLGAITRLGKATDNGDNSSSLDD